MLCSIQNSGLGDNYLMLEIFKFNMKAEDYFRNGKVYVWKETFAVVKSKKTYINAFANIIDKNETTVIIDQSKFNEKDAIETAFDGC